jgi:hypothetical protein
MTMRTWRIRAGFRTQGEAAAHLLVSRRTLIRWETGKLNSVQSYIAELYFQSVAARKEQEAKCQETN